MSTDHTKWVRWRWRQIQNHAGTQLAFEFFEKETWIQESFWSILSPFPSSLEKKGEERKIKANPASAPRIAWIFVFFESDQQWPAVCSFCCLPSTEYSQAENSFWQGNCRKMTYPDLFCFYLSSKVRKVEKVRKSHRTIPTLIPLFCDRGFVITAKSLR